MGLWKLLTTPLLANAETLRWQQPLLLGMRLRREVWWRVALLSACVVAGASTLAISIILSGGERVPLPAVLIGGLFGLLVAIYVAFRKDDWGGHVLVGPDAIRFRQTYPAFPVLLGVEQTTWPYASIRRCVIVPGKSLGSRYSVLVISSGESSRLLGVAGWVDPRDLGRRLKQKGVDVALAESIPGKLLAAKVTPVLAGSFLGVAGLLAIVAVVMTPRFGGEANMADRDVNEVREELLGQLPERVRDVEQFGAPAFQGVATGGAEEGFGGPPDTPAVGRDGILAGGSGGSPFRALSDSNQPLLGMTWIAGEWAGQRAIAHLEPLFERDAAIDGEQSALAPEGFAVGGIDVEADEFVFAVRLIYMRIKPDGRLDAGDTRMSSWLGFPAGRVVERLSGESAVSIGIHGRGAAVLDAVGLVFDR